MAQKQNASAVSLQKSGLAQKIRALKDARDGLIATLANQRKLDGATLEQIGTLAGYSRQAMHKLAIAFRQTTGMQP